jgi:hypothetical protein
VIVRIDVTTRPRASRPFASCPTRAGIRVVAGNRERPNTQRVRGFPILVHALRMRTRAAGLEVPVLVFGVDGLADHIRGARTREESWFCSPTWSAGWSGVHLHRLITSDHGRYV